MVSKIVSRLKRFKWLILLAGLLFGLGMYYYAKKIPPTYTSFASLFPVSLNSQSLTADGGLGAILGKSGSGGSINIGEANINFNDLAMSRTSSEAVALTKVPEFAYESVAVLLINEYNKKLKPWQEKIIIPKNSEELMIIGGSFVRGGLQTKVSKTGAIELRFTNTNPDLLTPISNIIIDKLSQFYIDLKITKARNDYNFMLKKKDSIESALKVIENKLVRMNNTTMFVNDKKLQYTIPQENALADRDRLRSMRVSAYNSLEDALWRLQRVTPIIKILDKPLPPHSVSATSTKIYAGIGFLIGALLSTLIVISDLLFKFLTAQVNKSLQFTTDTTADQGVSIETTEVEKPKVTVTTTA